MEINKQLQREINNNREREREREGNNVRNIQTVKYSEGNKIDREKEED